MPFEQNKFKKNATSVCRKMRHGQRPATITDLYYNNKNEKYNKFHWESARKPRV